MSNARRTLASGAGLTAVLASSLIASPAATATQPGENGLILFQQETE